MAQHVRLGELLIRSGLLLQAELRRALDQQQRVGGLLGTNLLELDALREHDLLRALGRQLSAPTVGVTDLRNVPEVVLGYLPRSTAADYHLLPFRLHGNTILIASIRPGNLIVEDAIQAQTQLMTRFHVGLEVRIWEALERFYGMEAPLRLARLLDKLNGQGATTRPLVVPAPPVRERPVHDAEGSLPSVVVEAGMARGSSIADEILWQALEKDTRREAPPPGAAEATPAAEPDPRSTAEVAIVVEPPPPETVDQAIEYLRTAERREKIAELSLAGCASLLRRRLLLAARGGRIIGWRGSGAGLERLRVHGLNFGATDSPMFLALDNGAPFWLGPVVDRPAHRRLLDVFGGGAPPDCVVVPIRVRQKCVAYLYGDNQDRSVAGVPIDELQRLADQIASALITYLYRRKHAPEDERPA